MLSTEIVLRALARQDPPRLPVHYSNRDLGDSDTATTEVGLARDVACSEPGMSEWGFVWHSFDQTMGQPREHPLADPDAIRTYRSPDPYAPGRLEHVPAFAANNAEKFLRFDVGISGFTRATFLRGFDDFLMDLYLEPARAEQVLDFVFDFENGIIEQATAYPIDAVCFGDDWGTQRGLMISPARWRAVFKPRYAAQFARIHRAGKRVWFHSCGDVWDIIGDFIDIGVDVLELLQPNVFGVERLGREFGGNVCFCCSIDHQRLAISGTREEIFSYARLLQDSLGADHGGFIAYIEDYASLGMDEAHYQWIREAFQGGALCPASIANVSH
jgi:hypothetical protein